MKVGFPALTKRLAVDLYWDEKGYKLFVEECSVCQWKKHLNFVTNRVAAALTHHMIWDDLSMDFIGYLNQWDINRFLW